MKLRDGDYAVLFAVRRHLNEKGATTVRFLRLNSGLGLASPQITASLNRLETAGYVRSGFRQGRRRARAVGGPRVYRLTAKGREATR